VGTKAFDWRKFLVAIGKPALVAMVVALLVSLGVAGLQPLYPQQEAPLNVQGTTHLTGLSVSGSGYFGGDLTVDDAAEFVLDTTCDRDLSVLGDASVVGEFEAQSAAQVYGALQAMDVVTVSGKLAALGWVQWSMQDAVSVVQDGSIEPSGSLQLLSSAGAVSTAGLITDTVEAGYWVMLMNSNANTITISDTAPCALAGNCALGQYDTLTLIFDGTRWVELDRSDN